MSHILSVTLIGERRIPIYDLQTNGSVLLKITVGYVKLYISVFWYGWPGWKWLQLEKIEPSCSIVS